MPFVAIPQVLNTIYYGFKLAVPGYHAPMKIVISNSKKNILSGFHSMREGTIFASLSNSIHLKNILSCRQSLAAVESAIAVPHTSVGSMAYA
jgi:hypothetical protein